MTIEQDHYTVEGVIHTMPDATQTIESARRLPEIAVITDLGDGNDGTIYPHEKLNSDQVEQAIQDVAGPEYRKKATRRWRCVDGRIPEGGLKNMEGYADPQIAGGYVIADISVDLMMNVMNEEDRHSEKVAAKTREAIADGIEVVIHGDNNVARDEAGDPLEETNAAGCKANVEQRTVLRRNAENADIVIPKAMAVAKAAGIDKYYVDQSGEASDGALADRSAELIEVGRVNAENDAYWDTAPSQVVDITIANGGQYEEVIEDHTEVVAVADCAEGAIDEEQYMRDHVVVLEDGTEVTLEAFIASIAEYKKLQFELAEKHDRTGQWAADKTLAVILQTVGTVKKLTKDGFKVAVTVQA